jgi:hypothetical protein
MHPVQTMIESLLLQVTALAQLEKSFEVLAVDITFDLGLRLCH